MKFEFRSVKRENNHTPLVEGKEIRYITILDNGDIIFTDNNNESITLNINKFTPKQYIYIEDVDE